MLRSSFLRSVVVCAISAAAAPACLAGDGYRFETYVTADYSGHAAALASSTVWSIFTPIDQPGFRLKVDGFSSINGNDTDVFSSAFMASNLQTLAALNLGYQFHWENFWVKLYAGAAYQKQNHLYWDAGALAESKGFGATAAIESYWQSDSGLWASANLGWLQFDNTGSFYGRLAYKFLDDPDGLTVSAGVETGATIKSSNEYRDGHRLDDADEYIREGALLNFRYGANELSISGGFARATDEGDWRPYGMISYGRKF